MVEVVRKIYAKYKTPLLYFCVRETRSYFCVRETRSCFCVRETRSPIPFCLAFGRHDADALILVVLVLLGSNAALLNGCT